MLQLQRVPFRARRRGRRSAFRRDDWARGTIKDWNKGRAIAIWVFTVIWNAISFPVAFVSSPAITKGKLILIFPLLGIILLISAVYQTLRMMKFGTSTCHLDRVPITREPHFAATSN